MGGITSYSCYRRKTTKEEEKEPISAHRSSLIFSQSASPYLDFKQSPAMIVVLFSAGLSRSVVQ